MYKRVCLYGGPGVGKSRLAAKIFTELKTTALPVELVDEAIKGMAWRKIEPCGFDSVWLFGKQLHREDVVLRSGGSVVTGGPLYQQLVYMYERNEPFADDLCNVADDFERAYPSLHILVKREVPYNPKGRYHTETEAKRIDELTTNLLKQRRIAHVSYDLDSFPLLMQYVFANLMSDKPE